MTDTVEIITFMFIPALSSFLATVLFLMNEGIGVDSGPFTLVIGFFELPSILLMLPMLDVLGSPSLDRDPGFLIGIVIPTLLNIVLFVFAGFVSWMWFPSRRIDSIRKIMSEPRNHSGVRINEASNSAICSTSRGKDESGIQAERIREVQALRNPYLPAPGVEVQEKAEQPSHKNLFILSSCLVIGPLIEALFGWLLLVLYGFASMHGPGVTGLKRLSLTLKKMLDPRDALWGTLLFLIGFISGLLIMFAGCLRLSQVCEEDVSNKKAATKERPTVP